MKFTLDDALEKVGDLAQTGIVKSTQVTEMAKLQISNMTEQENIKKLYIEIGKKYYTQYGSEPDALFQDQCLKIDQGKVAIRRNNLRIKELRNDDIILTEEKMPDNVVDLKDVTDSNSED